MTGIPISKMATFDRILFELRDVIDGSLCLTLDPFARSVMRGLLAELAASHDSACDAQLEFRL
ncbi:MAG TPA: hypothetical protein PK231_05780 [Acidocella sp.]|nr:hypothetical protein [Acidocella sp.]